MFKLSIIYLFLTIVALTQGCAVSQRLMNSTNYPYEINGQKRKPDGSPLNVSVNNTEHECWINLRGEIGEDTYRAFRLAADDADRRGCKDKWVMLESNGGLIKPAIDIGKEVRARGYFTTIPKIGADCRSSCGLIFIAGVRRGVPDVLLRSTIGFHQISDGRNNCSSPNSPESRAFLLYAKSMLPAESAETFHKYAMETACTSMKYLGPKDLVESGIATQIGGPSTF